MARDYRNTPLIRRWYNRCCPFIRPCKLKKIRLMPTWLVASFHLLLITIITYLYFSGYRPSSFRHIYYYLKLNNQMGTKAVSMNLLISFEVHTYTNVWLVKVSGSHSTHTIDVGNGEQIVPSHI